MNSGHAGDGDQTATAARVRRGRQLTGRDKRTLLVVRRLTDTIEQLTVLLDDHVVDLPDDWSDRLMTGVDIIEAGIEKVKERLPTPDG